MKDSQDIYVSGNKAAEITIEYNPLFIGVEMIAHLLEKYATSLAGAIATNMNKDEERGLE